MSVDTVRDGWSALARAPLRSSDVARLNAFIGEFHDPDVVWDMTNVAGWPESPVYRGYDGVRRVFAWWLRPWRAVEFEIELVESVGDSVVAVFAQRAYGRAGVAGSPSRFAAVTSLRDGRVAHVVVYSNLSEAVEAVGLTP
jgi:ketosteroid isomerase-like protein